MSHKPPIVSAVRLNWGRGSRVLLLLLLGWLAGGASALAAGPPPPSKPVPVARYAGSTEFPSVLLQKRAEGWKRVTKGQAVLSAEPLVTLPGFVSEVRSDKGVLLTMRGSVREFSRHPLMDFLMESAVTLHKSNEFDMDVTLDRGRIFLRNVKEKGPAKVRLRFLGEAWDLTLAEPGTEAGIDLVKHYTRDINWREGEEPRAELYFCLQKGSAELRPDRFSSYSLDAPPGPALYFWDSFTGARGPHGLKEVPPVWKKTVPDTELAKKTVAALKDLDRQLTGKKKVEDVLRENRTRDSASSRILALSALEAVDDVGPLIDALGDEDPAHALDRASAVFVLRRWISRGVRQGRALYDEKTKMGLLIDKGYTPREADTIFTLLHDFREEDRNNAETYDLLAADLRSKRVAIAELAHWHLARLALGVKLPAFNAADPLADRVKVSKTVEDLIEKKKLPPRPPAAPEKP